MSSGKIVQIIGAVVDVQFDRSSMPKVFDALLVNEAGLTLEVQQQLGDGIVRTIALGSTDGLKRGLSITNTGAATLSLTGTPTVVFGGADPGDPDRGEGADVGADGIVEAPDPPADWLVTWAAEVRGRG